MLARGRNLGDRGVGRINCVRNLKHCDIVDFKGEKSMKRVRMINVGKLGEQF